MKCLVLAEWDIFKKKNYLILAELGVSYNPGKVLLLAEWDIQY